MPVLPSSLIAARALNTTSSDPDVISVICAWPVSGQYGPGSRILYYVLVAACVLGRGSAWLRGACLAAALLLPAVAALHGIVLAAVHVDGAVDMDIYGAFQLCAIGVLAGPVTVKLSGTYFNAPGRNIIFIWTTVVLAGLLSLTVEFFRATPVPCQADLFSWGGNPPVCNITCDVFHDPSSPLRQGAQNNIYVIKTPSVFSFGAATLLSAACCIPAILSLVSMWTKILQQKWKKAFRKEDESDVQDQQISGTNAATPRRMMTVNENVRFYLKMVEIPFFYAAIIAILAIGEKNFFDYTVNYQTEPMGSIGQWGPIVGTGLAALGSLYAGFAAGGSRKELANSDTEEHGCTCQHDHHQMSNDGDSMTPSNGEMEERRTPEDLDIYQDNSMLSPQNTYHSTQSVVSPISDRHLKHSNTAPSRIRPRNSNDLARAATAGTAVIPERGSRHKVAAIFEKIGDKLGTPAPGAFDDTSFRTGLASDFPELPGERERNPDLPKIKAAYNPERNSEGLATPLRKQRSRSGSFNSVTSAAQGSDGGRSEPTSPIAESAGASVPGIAKLHARRTTLTVPKLGSLQNLVSRRSTISTSGAPPLVPPSPTIRVSEPPEDAIVDDDDSSDDNRPGISPTEGVGPQKT